MSTRSIVPDIANMLRRSPGLKEIQGIIDLYSKAACLIDTHTNKVETSNTKLSQLTAYTRQELKGIDLTKIIPTWMTITAIVKTPQIHTTTLVQRSGIQTSVEIKYVILGEHEDWAIVILEPNTKIQQKEIEEELLNQRWESLAKLINTIQENNEDDAYIQMLQTGQLLTGASFLAIFSKKNSAGLTLEQIWGNCDFLPKILNPKDISQLRIPYTWNLGKKTLSQLHKIALANKMNYISTIPLDQELPENGLLVIGDQIGQPTQELDNLMVILANIINLYNKNRKLLSILKNKIEEQTQNLIANQTIKDVVNDGIIFVDTDLQIKDINPMAEVSLGYSKSEVIGKQLESILIGATSISPILESLSPINPIQQNFGNIKIHRRDGKPLLVNVRAIPIISGEKTNQIAIMITDMSKDEEYQIKTRQLEQQALLGEVTAIFAHEVRNPINNISTGLQLMSINFVEDDPLQDQIERMKQDCDRLTDLMKSVLSFSGPREYKMEKFDVALLVENLLERWRSRMEKNEISCHVQIESLVPKIYGDHRALEQVFTNLISNAIQAMKPDGGVLGVKIETAKAVGNLKFVNIDITDTGRGIPDEIREKIFDPFFTTHQEGTGLGLAITKRIISAHRGQISVDSFPGGTMFQIRLPRENMD